MNYSAIEGQIETLLRAYTPATFSATNCQRNDWAVLDAKGTTYSAHISMGLDSRIGADVATDYIGEYGEHGATTALHTIAIVLAAKRSTGRGGDGAIINSLLSLTDSVIAYLASYPTLDGFAGIVDTQITSVTRPVQLSMQSQGPNLQPIGTHVAQRIMLRVIESMPLINAE